VNTFIKATEYWLPNRDRSCLELGGGLYAPESQLGRVSPEMSFARGEGLPGRAWESAAPVVLHQFEGSYFLRTKEAHADGLTCAIALPIFHGDYLAAVVVFFCGDGADHAGAIEVWSNDPRQGPDMTLLDGHYGRTAEAFEYISRRTSFRHGFGLPGQAWQQGAPVFLADLGRGASFMRSDSAERVGINRGLALPCATPGLNTYVLAFLSALGTPIAKRVEVWMRDESGQVLQLKAGFCEVQGPLVGAASLPGIAPGQGCIGQVWERGIPAISSALSTQPNVAAQVPGLSAIAAWPVIDEGWFVAVIALYF
jgi:hypothetical protein